MKCYGEWWGGSSYAPPTQEDRWFFQSEAIARWVFEERLSGWDPCESVSTPCVDDKSCMQLFESREAEYPYAVLVVGPRGGIRKGRV